MVIILKENNNSNSNNPNHNQNPKTLKLVQAEKSTSNQLPHTYFVHPQEGRDIVVEVDYEYLSIFDKKVKDYFIEKNRARREDTKKGIIHIGNLTDCVRRQVLLEQHYEDIDLSIWDCTDFMDGNGSENMIVTILDHGRNNTDEKGEYQKHIVFDDFTAHPDYIDDEEGVIFELKSSKKIKPFILSDDGVKSYIRQIVYYMVLNDMDKGRILIRYGLPMFPEYIGKEVDNKTGVEESIYKLKYHRDSGQFPFFSIKLTLKDGGAQTKERIKKALIDVIKPAYLKGDVTQIPILEDKPTNWKCNKYCKVKQFCDQIPDKQTDPATRYVLLNKHIDEATDKIRVFGRRKDKNV
jgi:hypothetical protein